MAGPQSSPVGQVRDRGGSLRDSAQHLAGHASTQLQTSLPRVIRSRSDESWIEIGSQPSSSSLSSATDEIITTGLRVQQVSDARRRRRQQQQQHQQGSLGPGGFRRRASSIGGSSQEEYDESESESDRAMTSSNEGLHLRSSPLRQELRHPAVRQYSSASSADLSEDEDDDDDENLTAIGARTRTTEPCFTPQPNAFTHPPASHNVRPQSQPQPTSYFSSSRSVRSARHSYSGPSQQQQQHTPYNMISPTHQADHDAALRASLSTLLSFATPGRSSQPAQQPKRPSAQTRPAAPQSNRVNPTSLGFVRESDLGGGPSTPSISPTTGAQSSAARRPSLVDKNKRKSPLSNLPPVNNPRSSSKDRSRATKKLRRYSSTEEIVSPTLLTWVVSAGVLVLVSALSFSAGYVYGRETGRAEIADMSRFADVGTSCGGEMRSGVGLRRFRLTGSAVRV